jgi:hypothetical protein
MADNTVFDSVFKTMVHKTPKLVIPLINEVFGRSYAHDERVVHFSNEHETRRGSKIDDTVFRLGDKIYHIECQSTPDTDMVVRMIEYDFSIALERALSGGAPYRMEFPASCVLFLRHNERTPDVLQMEVKLPDGNSFEYRVRVMKAQLIGEDEIFSKQLFLLLPYYLMRYEKALSQIANDDNRTAYLLAECLDLRMRLAEATIGQGEVILFEEIIELIIRVSDHITAAYETLQKKVRAVMGGEVLELWADRVERVEREAREAREQGLEQGLEQGINELSQKLLELGVSEELIAQAVAQVRGEEKAIL